MAKILIVDDAEAQRAPLREALEKSGHDIVEAQNGAEGLQRLKENAGVNLIICDVNMPVMDGITMCSRVSEDPAYKHIPIFMLTTEASVELKEAGKRIGVKAWITKPFDPIKLCEAVAKVTGKK